MGFWDRVDASGDCWVWTGAKSQGYGSVSLPGHSRNAHRAAYEMLVGPIPSGMTLDHLCRNTLCVNPDHLEPVTNRENVLRGIGVSALNARKTHCKYGHALTPANTYSKPSRPWQRECITCKRKLRAAYGDMLRASGRAA